MTWQTACRRRLLAEVRGTVLEIGAGRGANFAHFRPGVTWIGLEPARRRRTALAALAPSGAKILDAVAESVPLPDACCDAVVSTIVLCSVADQARALSQVRRVLRPGGMFVFLEHVAAPPGTRTRRLQRIVAPVSRALDSGCDPARDTAAAIEAAGFDRVETDTFSRSVGFGLRVPFVAGRAWA